jgi:hypothetical protein
LLLVDVLQCAAGQLARVDAPKVDAAVPQKRHFPESDKAVADVEVGREIDEKRRPFRPRCGTDGLRHLKAVDLSVQHAMAPSGLDLRFI